MSLVLTHCKLIDGTGAPAQENTFVCIEQDRIQAVGTGTAPAADAPDTVFIDCQGKTLLPGLIDCHVHIGTFDADMARLMTHYSPSYRVIRSVEVMKSMLEQGFTAVRDCAGADAGFRLAQQQGRLCGPRLFVCGCPLSQTGGHADFRQAADRRPPLQGGFGGLPVIIADGVDAVRQAAREQLRQGVDFLKVMAGGGAASPTDSLDSAQYSIEELRAIVFEATNAGTYVAAHCYSDRSILHSLEAGIKTIEHGNLMTAVGAQQLADADAWLVPTLATYFLYAKHGRELGLPENTIEKITRARDASLEGLQRAVNAGVKTGLGSDCLGPMQEHMGLSLPLQAQVMGPMNTLVAATRTNAEIIGCADTLGTIEKGKYADMILLAGDPLEDMSLFESPQETIQLIIQNGTLYKNTLS